MTDTQKLLADYVATGSETAFRELVSRYVDLVYSAAVRQVASDTHLAEDVTQTVFADLARLARSLSRDVMLGGWLHRHTCFVAGKTMRSERRRLARERQAVEMNSMDDHSAASLASVAPILDDAINQLGSEDRAAIMLRFFEQNDFASVGAALGSNEEAARKRVNRALDKLEVLLKRRGVALSVTALATALSAQAVTAAPVGMAVTISAAALSGTAGSSATTLAILKIMSMTKLKIGIIGAVVVAGVSIPWVMEHQTQTGLNEINATLAQQTEQNAHLVAENQRLSNLVAKASTPELAVATSPTSDTLKLRGEVGRLRRENSEIAASKTNGPSPLSGMTDNPEMYQLIRKQQRAGMSMVYKDFTNRINLSPEQSEKIFDLMADNVMENIDRITEVLKDGKTGDALNQVFAAQEAAFLEKLQTVLTPEELAQYKDYTQNIASYLTAEQFKGMMTGAKAAKDEKGKQIYQMMQEETAAVLANAGLPADFQTTPTLNFRNMASETEAEKNLKLLDDIYGRVIARLGPVLSEQEVEKFKEFRSIAINGNRMNLAINRKMMAPGAK
ncbi:MAG: sigma-70 family RNA polymerase sigma factor [Verrucomicrobiota bacterium]